MAEEQIAGFLTIDGEYVGGVVDFTFVDNNTNHTSVGTSNGNTALNIAFDRIKNVSKDVIGMIDENTDTMNYSSNNQIADNDTIKTVVEKLDTKIGANTELNSSNYVTKTDNIEKQINTLDSQIKSTNDNIGNRQYTYNEVLTDNESITNSLNAIDGFIHTEFYAEEMAYDGYEDITKQSGVSTYTISQDMNCTTPINIIDGSKVLNDIDYLSITDSDGKLIYKQGSLLPIASNVVKVTSYNATTREITLNFEPKTNFRINFKVKYNKKNVPDGKILNSSSYFNVIDSDSTNQANEIEYNNATSGLTATDVQSAIDELATTPSSSVSTNSANLTFDNEENYVELFISDTTITGTETIIISYEGSEDIAIQGLNCGVVSKSKGLGYTIFGGAPNGASGTYKVNIIKI